MPGNANDDTPKSKLRKEFKGEPKTKPEINFTSMATGAAVDDTAGG